MVKRTVSYGVVGLIGCVLAALVVFTLWQLYRQSGSSQFRSLHEDVMRIQAVLQEIDATCEIIEIAHERNYIDFLSVSRFSGSRVGPLKLKDPSKWEGPYLEIVPLVQGKMYELVKMKDGYGIVPGSGVMLANGKRVGTDIVFDSGSDIDTYLTAEIGLEFENKPLIAKFVPRMYEPKVGPVIP